MWQSHGLDFAVGEGQHCVCILLYESYYPTNVCKSDEVQTEQIVLNGLGSSHRAIAISSQQ